MFERDRAEVCIPVAGLADSGIQAQQETFPEKASSKFLRF